jgi:hypothetical protein
MPGDATIKRGNVLNQLVILFAVGMEFGEHSHSIFMPASRHKPPRRIIVTKDQQQDDLNRAWNSLHKDGKLERPVAVDVQSTKGELNDTEKSTKHAVSL